MVWIIFEVDDAKEVFGVMRQLTVILFWSGVDDVTVVFWQSRLP